jgi:two-component system sensor histidine kinase KdpD
MLNERRPWLRYVYGVLLVVAGTLLGALVQPYLSAASLVMIYLLVVVVAAITLGRGPAILVAIMSVLAFDFFFVHPRLTLAMTDRQDFFTFVALLIVGLVISSLAALSREHAQAAERRARQNAALYALSRDLAMAFGMTPIVQAVLTNVCTTFRAEATVLLPAGGKLTPVPDTTDLGLADSEAEAAAWAFGHDEVVGDGTDRLSSAGARYLPLKTARGVIGVLGVRFANPDEMSPDHAQLLETFASQAALAIERGQLAEQASRAEVLQAAEKLQGALLNSILHDLRTPLVSIVGALSSLQEDSAQLDVADRRSLVDNALGEAERLNRLVGNLLDMTRIEAGALKVRRELCDVQDLIGAAVEQLDRRLDDRPVTIDVPPDMPLVSMDFVLMEQVLVNLVDNAIKYSPPDAPIEVSARTTGGQAYLEVADRGDKIPVEDLERVFDKFYRVGHPGRVSGTGLGLSICRGIVEAHGGRVWAANREGGGTVLTVSLPLNGFPPGEEAA